MSVPVCSHAMASRMPNSGAVSDPTVRNNNDTPVAPSVCQAWHSVWGDRKMDGYTR